MRISDKKLFDTLMVGKAVRRVGWESMPHRPYFVKMKPYRNRFMLYDDEWQASHYTDVSDASRRQRLPFAPHHNPHRCER